MFQESGSWAGKGWSTELRRQGKQAESLGRAGEADVTLNEIKRDQQSAQGLAGSLGRKGGAGAALGPFEGG